MGPYLNNSLDSGAQVKNSFQPLLFFFYPEIFKSPVLLKNCKGAAHHNNSSADTQKRAYLTLCLLPPSERYIFIFLLKKITKQNKKKMMLCRNLPHVWKGDKSSASVRWSHRASTNKDLAWSVLTLL